MSEGAGYTKRGSKMDPKLRSKIVVLLSNPECDGLTQAEVATKVGVSESTVWRYLTSDVWEEVRKNRKALMMQSLAQVDRAVFAKAAQGDLTAAKLIYSRWDVVKEADETSLETLKEVEEELSRLNEEIEKYEQQLVAGEIAELSEEESASS